MKKVFLYDNDGYFLQEASYYSDISYPNSTEIAPDYGDRDREIYIARFDRFTQQWNFEYHPEWLHKKAKELDLELPTIQTMTLAEIQSGKLPPLDKRVEEAIAEDNRENVRKSVNLTKGV